MLFIFCMVYVQQTILATHNYMSGV